ncbi:MAG: redoxin domain-containing protein [Gemmatales bacterium]|nr:redoxin domain-containing protein [Gemmatales bacterium]MCS7160811.1 redoxin domain-containing protein [Gemmatales bacterium]
MRTALLASALAVWWSVHLWAQNRPGEVNTPPARGERKPDTLKVGDLAPDFTLPDPTGKNSITLSAFRGNKPVVLIFGSYT